MKIIKTEQPPVQKYLCEEETLADGGSTAE